MISQAHHHRVFGKFRRWKGHVPDGFLGDFLGIMTRISFFEQTIPDAEAGVLCPKLPAYSEEYFEWIALLEAVTNAQGYFTMIELGAGWGRWLVRAAFASCARGLPCTLVGIEAEPTHFQWMKQHFRDNGLNPREHTLIQAAVAPLDGTVWFRVGSPFQWYGQQIAASYDRPPELWWQQMRRRKLKESGYTFRLRKVKAVGLDTLLRPLATVDLIDLDIQGAELGVLEAARDALGSKVKRVHVEVHNQEIESGMRRFFSALSWKNVIDYPGKSVCDTPWGHIEFQDGHQDWINPRWL